MYHPIDYSKIAEAKNYYESLGYKYMETPWIVDDDALNLTRPAESFPHYVDCGWNNIGALVGSGEQGFIELMLNGKLEPGKYQTITPCFRDDKEDELHQQYFMKLELIDYMPEKLVNKDYNQSLIRYESYFQMVNEAREFFNNYFDYVYADFVDSLGCQTDIFSPKKRIELGSYGFREYNGHVWVYGSGCAEPRLSIAMEKENA